MSTYSAIIRTCLLTVIINSSEPDDLYYECLYRPSHPANATNLRKLEDSLVEIVMNSIDVDVRLTRCSIERLLRSSRASVLNKYKVSPIVDLIMEKLEIMMPYCFINTAQVNNPAGMGPIKIVEGFIGTENEAARRFRERIRHYDRSASSEEKTMMEPSSPVVMCA